MGHRTRRVDYYHTTVPDQPGEAFRFLAGVNVYASTGVAGADGGYGYVIYLRPEAVDRAATVLGV